MRLNQYIARSGICSRREADSLITAGKVKVNGKTVTELGTKVAEKDQVTVDGAVVNPESHVYLLLHKPKDTITTTDDEQGRRTVMDLVEDATGQRVYPVGRLDRHTTGVLLLTNDGDLAHRLMHPSYQVRKIYEVQTAAAVSDEQLSMLRKGVQLDDGPAAAYHVERIDMAPDLVRLSIREGRNRQVRRMFEAIGHEILRLHRSDYAGLTTRGVRSGRWRPLTEKEVQNLRIQVKLLQKMEGKTLEKSKGRARKVTEPKAAPKNAPKATTKPERKGPVSKRAPKPPKAGTTKR